MVEKNAFANLLDKMAQGKQDKGEDFNVLPKPATQDIGYGLIVWQWFIGDITVEGALATQETNRLSLEQGDYAVTIKMPENENYIYSLVGDTAKDVGKCILSAWNWKEIWKLHAGDFLLEKLSKEPTDSPFDSQTFDSIATKINVPDPLKVLAPKKPEEETSDA
jgi:hypothetical protein